MGRVASVVLELMTFYHAPFAFHFPLCSVVVVFPSVFGASRQDQLDAVLFHSYVSLHKERFSIKQWWARGQVTGNQKWSFGAARCVMCDGSMWFCRSVASYMTGRDSSSALF